MRLLRSLAPVLIGALCGVETASCGLFDVFRAAGFKDVVIAYAGDTLLSLGQRVAPVVSVTAEGAPVSNPPLSFSSSDTTVLALTSVGDTLVACRTGHVLLTIQFALTNSMVTGPGPSTQASIRITGPGTPPPTCP
jgi:hypothetical protein